eukprot:3351870-Pleurochrysis_carterae.AAC.1
MIRGHVTSEDGAELDASLLPNLLEQRLLPREELRNAQPLRGRSVGVGAWAWRDQVCGGSGPGFRHRVFWRKQVCGGSGLGFGVWVLERFQICGGSGWRRRVRPVRWGSRVVDAHGGWIAVACTVLSAGGADCPCVLADSGCTNKSEHGADEARLHVERLQRGRERSMQCATQGATENFSASRERTTQVEPPPYMRARSAAHTGRHAHAQASAKHRITAHDAAWVHAGVQARAHAQALARLRARARTRTAARAHAYSCTRARV